MRGVEALRRPDPVVPAGRRGRLQLLHVHSGNLFGGIETVLLTLQRERAACPDLEHEFALCFAGRFERELEKLGAEAHDLGEVRASRPWQIVAARRRLREVLEHKRFDAVVCHSSWPVALLGATVAKAGTPLVVWMHDAIDGRHWEERLARRARPSLVICNSRFTASTAGWWGADVKPKVIYNPMESSGWGRDSEVRRRVRAELGAGVGETILIQVSRMEGWKGHRLHLRALARLAAVPGWSCWIVGGTQRPEETAYARELRQMADASGLNGRVRFLGQRGDVPALLAGADVFCQPNEGPEPFGMVFIEALAAGLPVVTTAMGGPEEIVTADCGMLTTPGDDEALAAALQRLIEQEGLRRRLGVAGPERARTLCSPEVRIRELYAALWQAAGTQPR